VAKEVMTIKDGNTTGHSIKKFLGLFFAGKHPKLISKGTKTAAAEAAVTAAEAIAVADLEKANRLAAEFEALVGGALTIAFAQETEDGASCASAGSNTGGSACRRPARSIARKSRRPARALPPRWLRLPPRRLPPQKLPLQRYTRIAKFRNHHQQTATFRDLRIHF
jgi:hypothetical protein